MTIDLYMCCLKRKIKINNNNNNIIYYNACLSIFKIYLVVRLTCVGNVLNGRRKKKNNKEKEKKNDEV